MFESYSYPVNLILSGLILGVGATLIMDVWAAFLKLAFDVSGLNLSMLGRWIGYLFKGKLLHNGIGQSPPIAGEALIGWVCHYLIGITFAGVLLFFWGTSWLKSPTLGPALIIGLGTLVFPYFLMQPGFGMGIAASKLPNSHIVQMKSLMAHTVYGIGLFLAAKLISKLFP